MKFRSVLEFHLVLALAFLEGLGLPFDSLEPAFSSWTIISKLASMQKPGYFRTGTVPALPPGYRFGPRDGTYGRQMRTSPTILADISQNMIYIADIL